MNLRIHSLGAIAIGLLLALAGAQTASAAHVPSFSKPDQKCRDSIAKNFAKAISSADKVIAGCHKNRNNDKVLPTVDCNDLDQSDTKDKFSKAQTKVTGAVQKSCIDADGVTAAVLEEFISCPNPCGTDLALNNPMTTYAELGQCLACLAGDIAERRATVQLGMPTQPLTKEEAKCHAAIAKGYGKHTSTLIKERQACQKDEDTDGDLSTALQPCDTSDLKGKILAAAQAAPAGLDSAGCGSVNLANLDSCDTTLGPLKTCLLAEDDARGGEGFSSGYELGPNICPSRVDSKILAGNGINNSTSRTFLDIGWKPLAHDSDIVDQYTLSSDITCPGSPPCGVCTVDGISQNGPQYAAFARCRSVSLMSVPCTMPFQNDPACGGGICGYVLGPPLPLSSGGTPTCNVNFLARDISGTVNPDDGSAELNVPLKTFVMTPGTITKPCPVCVGDTTPLDGIKDGVCGGTAIPCDTQGFDSSFAPEDIGQGLSMDCAPGPPNISGAGLTINLTFTTGSSSLGFENACDSPNGALDCACGQCSGLTSFPCRNDAECADIGPCSGGFCTDEPTFACLTNGDCNVGTCTSKGAGVNRAPNDCSDLTCTDVGNEEGKCMSGNASDTTSFCDGVVRGNDDGYVQCVTNQDCIDTDPGCDDPNTGAFEGCGLCTIDKVDACFIDPIEATGDPDVNNPLLVATFCLPPTNNAGVNGAAGLPGPARVRADMLTELAY